jgi:small GTP-binding protein
MDTQNLDNIIWKIISETRKTSRIELHLNGLFFCQLEAIPEEIFTLENLRILNVSGGWGGEKTRITKIPPQIEKLRNLETLNLSKNRIKEIPKEVYDLKNLRELYLSYNEIEYIDSCINQLTELRRLDLSFNKIKKIPKTICDLKNLEYLSLDNNQLEKLPVEISDLKRLQVLDLINNKIQILPLAIGKIDDLTRISVNGNNITNIPIEILRHKYDHSGEGIINYCKSVLKEDVIRLFEAKLLIVGEGSVGKTCLLKRIIYDKVNSNELTTEGIDIDKWFFSKDQIDNFRVNIWDFGGQEIYHATHQFFLTKRSLYIFVWAARKDEVDFDYWLNVIKLLSDNSPTLVVLNKIDERIKMIDEQHIQRSFNNIVGFHKVSALYGNGIIEFVKNIKNQIVNIEHIGEALPKVWITIRETLENLDQNYIDYKEYKRICAKYNLTEEKADFLSKYFHDLGVFLHFHDNAVLKAILFLKPEWATNAVYRLIDTKEVISNYGKFHFNQLDAIWTEYPADKHLHLIELMKKFELCFQIQNTQEYIIPELLQPSSPDFEWNYNNNLRFEYHYEFMPSGIISRFIALSHNLIYNNIFWKNGIIIKREHTKSLLVSDRFKRKVGIWIDGREKKELLAIVREKIDYIHQTLNNPSVKQMLQCNCIECIVSKEPFFYDYSSLKKFSHKGKKNITCLRSIEEVSVEKLLGGIEDRKTITEEKLLSMLRSIKSKYDDEKTLFEKANRLIQLQPNFMGIGVNLNKLIEKILHRNKDKIDDEMLALPSHKE